MIHVSLGLCRRHEHVIIMKSEMTNEKGETISAQWGPVPVDICPLQEARDGEDLAAAIAIPLQSATPKVHIDCAGTVAVIKKGKTFATFLSTGTPLGASFRSP